MAEAHHQDRGPGREDLIRLSRLLAQIMDGEHGDPERAAAVLVLELARMSPARLLMLGTYAIAWMAEHPEGAEVS